MIGYANTFHAFLVGTDRLAYRRTMYDRLCQHNSCFLTSKSIQYHQNHYQDFTRSKSDFIHFPAHRMKNQQKESTLQNSHQRYELSWSARPSVNLSILSGSFMQLKNTSSELKKEIMITSAMILGAIVESRH